VVWVAQSTLTKTRYLALFNISESSQALQYAWKELGFPAAKYKLRDLWQRRDVGAAASMEVTVPSHGVVLYRVSPGPTTER
jgi:alpha-galactosidase